METVTAVYFQTIIFYSLLAITTALCGIYFYIENSRTVRMGRKIPGPKTLPIFGNALEGVGVDPNEVLDTLLPYDIYGPVARAFIGTKLFVFLYHPRDIEVILNSPVHIDKSYEYRFFKPWLGDGLLISTGEKWRLHRKFIAPSFHLNVLKSFVPLFYENSKNLVTRLRDQIGREFDCHDYLSTTTVEILLGTAMGIKETNQQKGGYDYAMAVMEMCDIIHRRQYKLNLRYDFFFKFSHYWQKQKDLLNIIHGLTSAVINTKNKEHKKTSSNVEEQKNDVQPPVEPVTSEKKENIQASKMHYARDDLDELDDNDVGEKKRCAFLEHMLELAENGAQLSEKEIEEEVNTIMFEGHDTTAAASSFVLCVLGIHQDIQDRVYEELNEIFNGSNRPCTYQDTLKMKYLERVILETLRLFPPVPVIAREINEDVEIVTGRYVLPRSTTVLVLPFKAHRLSEFYPDPEKFNPDNFLPERMQGRPYYSFIPFSAGPRSCVGRKYAMLKLKVLLSTILRNYKMLSDITEKDFRMKVDIILKRVDGFRIKIEPRNKSSQEMCVQRRVPTQNVV